MKGERARENAGSAMRNGGPKLLSSLHEGKPRWTRFSGRSPESRQLNDWNRRVKRPRMIPLRPACQRFFVCPGVELDVRGQTREPYGTGVPVTRHGRHGRQFDGRDRT